MNFAELETPNDLALPRVVHLPEGAARPGHEWAVTLAANCGLILDPVQEFCLGLAMLEAEDGSWAADVFDWLVARQNGKNEVAIVRELFGLAVLGETIVHSSHHFSTTKRSFKRLWNLVQSHPDVASMVTSYHHSATAGYNIALSNGSSIEFIARGSAGAGR